MFPKGSFSPPSTRAGDFSSYSLLELGRASRSKSHRTMGALQQLGPLEFLCPRFAHSAAVHHSSGFSLLALIPIEVSVPVGCDSLYSRCLCLQFGGHSLPCDLTSLMDQLLIFQFVLLFPFY